MGCVRVYATLRNFVSPDLALRKCMSQEALGPPGDKTEPLKTWGGSLSPLATVRVHPQVLRGILAPLHREAHH